MMSVILSGCDGESFIENKQVQGNDTVDHSGNGSGKSAELAPDKSPADTQIYNLGITDETLEQIALDKTELNPQHPALDIKEKILESKVKVKGNVFVRDDWLENPKESLDGAEVGLELKFDQ